MERQTKIVNLANATVSEIDPVTTGSPEMIAVIGTSKKKDSTWVELSIPSLSEYKGRKRRIFQDAADNNLAPLCTFKPMENNLAELSYDGTPMLGMMSNGKFSPSQAKSSKK